jgi:hypothetical protein
MVGVELDNIQILKDKYVNALTDDGKTGMFF